MNKNDFKICTKNNSSIIIGTKTILYILKETFNITDKKTEKWYHYLKQRKLGWNNDGIRIYGICTIDEDEYFESHYSKYAKIYNYIHDIIFYLSDKCIKYLNRYVDCKKIVVY